MTRKQAKWISMKLNYIEGKRGQGTVLYKEMEGDEVGMEEVQGSQEKGERGTNRWSK